MAVLEGVAFASADGQQALATVGTSIGEITVIGGGSRSALWGQMLAGAEFLLVPAIWLALPKTVNQRQGNGWNDQ